MAYQAKTKRQINLLNTNKLSERAVHPAKLMEQNKCTLLRPHHSDDAG
jgi:hypothetical protein